MRKAVRIFVGVAVVCLAAGCLSCGGRADLPGGFVHVTERVPDAILEIRYHSTYNFVGKRIDGYDAPEAILTEEAAAALRKASDALKERGYRLKIYDAYRPQRAVDHFMRWAADRGDAEMKAVFYPELDKSVLFEQGYIAAKSGHSRGSTVDLTLVEAATGREVDMGGAFDYFGRRSHSDFTEGLSSVQIANRRILREAMVAAGFKPLAEEWWHFTLKDEPYPDRYFDFPVQCSTEHRPEDAGAVRRFTQVSLFSTLLCGRYGGVVDLGWVKGRGNLMIATMDRLDGEMMMVDGVVYQVRSDGTVRCPADSETIPYGTIADFRPETTETIGPIASYEDFEAAMNKLFPDENIPLAVHLTGEFRTMRTRSVERQEKDGLGLAEAAKTEAKFELGDTTGDLLGFRLPAYLKGVNAPGWHLHYIDVERKRGGHVLNFALKGGTLKACRCGQFDIRLPGCPATLDGLDLSRDRSEELKRAEAER